MFCFVKVLSLLLLLLLLLFVVSLFPVYACDPIKAGLLNLWSWRIWVTTTHVPVQSTDFGELFFLWHIRSTHQCSWAIWISQPIECPHCFLCYCSLWHHNAATIAPVVSQWSTHCSALGNQEAALLVLLSSNNPHDINCIRRKYCICPLKQRIIDTVKFSMHDKSENMCCCGIWKWTNLGCCYSK